MKPGMLRAILILTLMTPATVVTADDVDWTPVFPSRGFDGTIYAIVSGGDGDLYVGGDFTQAGGDIHAEYAAAWDGESWRPLASGPGDLVFAMASHDDGSGPAVYAAGIARDEGEEEVGHVVRWDGRAWRTVGGAFDEAVFALASFDGMLVAGGSFRTIGGKDLPCIARWDGTSWLPLGDTSDCTKITSLRVLDDGSGPALYATGSFDKMDGVAVGYLARWADGAWSRVGQFWFDGTTFAIEFMQDAGRPVFFASGHRANHSSLAKLDRATGVWEEINEPAFRVVDLELVDLGNGPTLYAAGGPGDGIARWDGTNWGEVEGGLGGRGFALRGIETEQGGALYAGGSFRSAGGLTARNIARLDREGWSPVGSDDSAGLGADDLVYSMYSSDRGEDGDVVLYVGGRFTRIGGVVSPAIAAWDGTRWNAMGIGEPYTSAKVYSIADFDEGAGPRLFVGATVDQNAAVLMSREAGAWEVQLILNGPVGALVAHDNGTGSALYVGGSFTVAGGEPVRRLLEWRSQGWAEVGGGLDQYIEALASFDDGSGSALYVAGRFEEAGGQSIRGLARWDGSGWSAVGGGLETRYSFPAIRDLLVHDDGTGPSLFVAGDMVTAGGLPVSGVARWDGKAWNDLDGGFDRARTLATVVDDEGEVTLWAGANAGNLERWNGSRWEIVPGALRSGAVYAMSSYQEPEGAVVYVGGGFNRAGDVSSLNVARWGRRTCRADVDGNRAVDVADLRLILAFWGECDECPEDIDKNGVVDMRDLRLMLMAWGSCP